MTLPLRGLLLDYAVSGEVNLIFSLTSRDSLWLSVSESKFFYLECILAVHFLQQSHLVV